MQMIVKKNAIWEGVLPHSNGIATVAQHKKALS